MNNRYSVVNGNFQREIVLLKGSTCSYGKCKFCNYTLDNSNDLKQNFILNKTVLDQVSGQNGVLEVINSGNVFDLDQDTLNYIVDIVNNKNIHTLYFESYLNEIKNFDIIRKMFPNVDIRFRIGIETFNDELRGKLGKPFVFDKLKDSISNEYYSACLLFCIENQSMDDLLFDIKTGLEYFKQLTINVFVDNDTEIKSNKELKRQFINELYPIIKDNNRLEILIDNKDLGVYEQ